MPKIALSRSTVCLEIKLLSSVIHVMLETLEGIVCKSFSKFGSILEESVSRAKKCLKSTKMLLKRILCPFDIHSNHLSFDSIIFALLKY